MSDTFDPTETYDARENDAPFVDYRRPRPSFGRQIRRPLVRTTPWWIEQTPASEPQKYPTTRVRASFTYDLFGDISIEDWEQRFVVAQAQMWIEGYQILLVQTGAFGLRHLIMMVDTQVPADEKERVQQSAYHLLSVIIKERDIQLLQVTPI